MHSVFDTGLSFLPKRYNWHNKAKSLLDVLKPITILAKNLKP